MKYPEYASELKQMLEADQQIWKGFWREYFDRQETDEFRKAFAEIRESQHGHTMRMLEILDEIREPSLSNIGADAAQAMSVIALHDSLDTLRQVCSAFTDLYQKDKQDTYFQAIPSMVDRVRILERKPQVFGTQWDLAYAHPFLPTVENFEHINQRREEYDIAPLRWPKSLAIAESRQPWLKQPLAEAEMRDITDEEFAERYQMYVD